MSVPFAPLLLTSSYLPFPSPHRILTTNAVEGDRHRILARHERLRGKVGGRPDRQPPHGTRGQGSEPAKIRGGKRNREGRVKGKKGAKKGRDGGRMKKLKRMEEIMGDII